MLEEVTGWEMLYTGKSCGVRCKVRGSDRAGDVMCGRGDGKGQVMGGGDVMGGGNCNEAGVLVGGHG